MIKKHGNYISALLLFRTQKDNNQENDEREKLDEIRGTPMDVGTLEEFIDENHVIVSTANGPEYYVNLLSFVDRGQLEPGSTVLMHRYAQSRTNACIERTQ